jgi:DNA (cytosine-5)-methyltransferase 1
MHSLDKGRIPLILLTECTALKPEPLPELLYEQGMVEENNKAGYTCAYRFSSNKSAYTPKPTGERPRATLDLFAGCGGLSCGFQQEGYEETYMVELEPIACATLAINFPDAKIYQERVEHFLETCESETMKSYPKVGDIGHINAGCPCQGNSRVNTGDGVNDEANNRMAHELVKYVKYFRPLTITMENVPAMQDKGSKKKKRENLDAVIADLLLLDYQVRICVVNASDYGDPQNRLRLILFAAQRGLKLPDVPPPTHTTKVSVGETFSDLESVQPTRSGRAETKNGALILDHWEHGTQLPPKADGIPLLLWDRPANTVRTKNAIIHYNKERCITVRERARIQSFPDNFKFAGSPADKMRQIGNAVPVNLARAIARSVLVSYKKG